MMKLSLTDHRDCSIH